MVQSDIKLDCHRLGDCNTGGGCVTRIPQTTVFANNLLVVVDGSIGTSHPPCPPVPIHCMGNWVTNDGGPKVFAENIPVNKRGDPDTCGHVRAKGSPNVFLGTVAFENVPVDMPELATERQIGVMEDDDPDSDDGLAIWPAYGPGIPVPQSEIDRSIQNGSGPGVPPPATEPPDTTTPAAGPAIITTGCEDITDETAPSYQLSPNYSLAELSTLAVFPHPIVAQHGLTRAQIICNLKKLAINVLEPLVAKYSKNAIIVTSGFRKGTGSSQHERGQAVDVQFRNITKDEYYVRANWVRDNISYDQFILEYGNAPHPWFHLSFAGTPRRQVLTMTSPGSYSTGLTKVI